MCTCSVYVAYIRTGCTHHVLDLCARVVGGRVVHGVVGLVWGLGHHVVLDCCVLVACV